MKSANERIKSRSQGHRRSTGRSKSIDPITSARVEYALSTLAVSGKLTGSRTERLSARVDPGLIRAARTKTGLKNRLGADSSYRLFVVTILQVMAMVRRPGPFVMSTI